jgi:hypothetical protein
MYREVTMIELKEVLRPWGEGLPKKRLAASSDSIRKRCVGISRRRKRRVCRPTPAPPATSSCATSCSRCASNR